MTESPRWLVEFQREFSAVLRAPLDRTLGALQADVQQYPEGIAGDAVATTALSARERLAVYNRQYWYRLFSVLQRAYPLTTHLLGPWVFNGLASRYFEAHPPTHRELDRVAVGFSGHLLERLECEGAQALRVAAAPGRSLELPLAALMDAVRLDAAWRAVFVAPAAGTFSLSPADAARLALARLERAPAVALVWLGYPLVELRVQALSRPLEKPLPVPMSLSEPVPWLLVRTQRGVGYVKLERTEGQLFEELFEYPVGAALARVEQRVSENERASLPQKTQAWLARSVRLGVWSGVAFAASACSAAKGS